MQIRCMFLAVMIGGLITSSAEVVQLRDKAAVVGKILAEKKDAVVVDLGYTVLTVPKNQIVRVSKEAAPETHSRQAPPPETSSKSGNSSKNGNSTAKAESPELFQSGGSAGTEKSVRELVSEIGEGVVQVRTPGGMGSGFFLNE